MSREPEEYGHPELVGGGETEKHSHPGNGGGGPFIQHGVRTDIVQKVLTVVTFPVAFATPPTLTVTIEAVDGFSEIKKLYTKYVTATDFWVHYEERNAMVCLVHWQAIGEAV